MFTIDHIIWSKNRPAQLELLLRSIKDHFKNIGNIFILWKHDNDVFLKGYEKLINDYKLINNIIFIQEFNFENQIKDILKNNVKTEYVFGNSDDNVFIKNVNFDDLYLDNKTVAFSLRLGESINFCMPANLEIKVNNFIEKYPYLKWDWTLCDKRGCWGYPHPCDSNIYRKDYWYELIKDGKFNNPRQLEDWMNEHRDYSLPYMISFKESHLISIQANQLEQGANIKTLDISLDELNNNYLQNKVISTSNLYETSHNACHVLLKYKY